MHENPAERPLVYACQVGYQHGVIDGNVASCSEMHGFAFGEGD